MTKAELAAFNVADMADDDCHLFCWTTHKHLPIALRLLESWVFRYRSPSTGIQRDMGFGSALDVTLERPRAKAAVYRAQLVDGIDPIDTAQLSKQASLAERVGRQTFGDCCARYIAAHRAGWRNPKHIAQWESALATYCEDLIPLPVDAIDVVVPNTRAAEWVRAGLVVGAPQTPPGTRKRLRIMVADAPRDAKAA